MPSKAQKTLKLKFASEDVVLHADWIVYIVPIKFV